MRTLLAVALAGHGTYNPLAVCAGAEPVDTTILEREMAGAAQVWASTADALWGLGPLDFSGLIAGLFRFCSTSFWANCARWVSWCCWRCSALRLQTQNAFAAAPSCSGQWAVVFLVLLTAHAYLSRFWTAPPHRPGYV